MNLRGGSKQRGAIQCNQWHRYHMRLWTTPNGLGLPRRSLAKNHRVVEIPSHRSCIAMMEYTIPECDAYPILLHGNVLSTTLRTATPGSRHIMK